MTANNLPEMLGKQQREGSLKTRNRVRVSAERDGILNTGGEIS